MRIALSLVALLTAGILPAHAGAADPSSAYGISTSHLQQAAPSTRAYRARGQVRSYGRAQARSYGRATAHRHAHAVGGASASRGCLTGETRALLGSLEARFGGVKVISTCRPGAVIAGSGRPSQHRYGKAVDFMPPPGQRAAVMAWLRGNANGAVITYASGHIHFDTGGYRNFAISAKARNAQARAR